MTRPRQHGFTLIEILMGVGLAAVGVMSTVGILSVSDGLSRDSRLRLRTSASYRRAQEAVGAELRNAAVDTLAGFDESQEAVHPTFKRVVGLVDDAVDYSEEMEIQLRTTPVRSLRVGGVGDVEVGDLVVGLVGEPGAAIVRDVVKDSFRVRQEGRNLVIHLALVRGPNPRNRRVIEGATVVSLRN